MCTALCGWPASCTNEAVSGSVVTLVCDRSDRYDTTFGDDGWLREQGIQPSPYREVLEKA
jgi:cysteine synthase